MTLIDVMVKRYGAPAVAAVRDELGVGATDAWWEHRLEALCAAQVKGDRPQTHRSEKESKAFCCHLCSR